MSEEKCLQGAGPPSFCFICSRQLQRARGIGKNLFYFRLVRDPKELDGISHRVHHECVERAEEQGFKLEKLP